MTTDPTSAPISDTAALRTTVAAISGQRQAVMASGPDTEAFLQGQLSQDVASMAPHESRWSLLLHPQGKVSAWLRVTRLEGEQFMLDVDAGWAEEIVGRLERFKLRTACELTIMPWTSLSLVGRGAIDVEVAGGELEVHDQLAGVPIIIVFGEEPTAPGVAELSNDAATALRIEAGRPAMGTELDESTIPAATGIVEQSVSFTKGCYTGQELVARIDSRGNNVPKRLVGLVFDHAAQAADGAVLVADESTGQTTSTGYSAVLGAPVALAYVSRKVEAGAVATVDGQAVTVHELPLVAG